MSTPVDLQGPLPRARVLVVEDEEPLGRLIASYLLRDGYDTEVVADGRGAIAVARANPPDVVVLDLGLPGADGIEVCRTLRTFSDCYVIMLTARVEEVDRLIGLSVGADDYLTKPFSPRELVARVGVMLRRPRGFAGGAGAPEVHEAVEVHEVLAVGELSVDLTAREVHLAGRVVELTRTEFDLLAVLVRQPRRAFSRDQLTEQVWGPGWFGDPHLVDVHLGHVRRKLGDDSSAPVYVQTVRGYGYRLGPGK
ncbi:response regulator transcription factor [Demequina lutea]|uniref:DNA-binding response OmpR family regulator n=1 Tax=Demequina lutea TaxID=431489 RepID=A0A7Z0CJZ7_9MICO|nr:response regulator transcription factor [Demequina lutea]NYI41312.1 DNA-binding response OmpR family regulator [Demequina lutea]